MLLFTSINIAPVQPQRGPKDPTRCELPGCMKPKYVEGAKTFDFCGRTHANEAERIGFTVQRGKQLYGL